MQVLNRIIGFFTRSPPLLRPKPKGRGGAAAGREKEEEEQRRRRHPHARAAAVSALATGSRLQFAQQQQQEQKENKRPGGGPQQQGGGRRVRGRGLIGAGSTKAAAAAAGAEAAVAGGSKKVPRKSGGSGGSGGRAAEPLAQPQQAADSSHSHSHSRKRARTTGTGSPSPLPAVTCTGEALHALSCEARFGLSLSELLALPSVSAEEALSPDATLALFVLPDPGEGEEEAAAAEAEVEKKPRRTAREGAGQRGWKQQRGACVRGMGWDGMGWKLLAGQMHGMHTCGRAHRVFPCMYLSKTYWSTPPNHETIKTDASAAEEAALAAAVVACPGFRLLPPEEVAPLTAANNSALKHRRSERIAEAYTDDEGEGGDGSGSGSTGVSLYVL